MAKLLQEKEAQLTHLSQEAETLAERLRSTQRRIEDAERRILVATGERDESMRCLQPKESTAATTCSSKPAVSAPEIPWDGSRRCM